MLTAAAADWWPRVLTRRMDAAARPAHAGGARPGRWSALPRTPTGAVTAKEIRMWVRDPIRLTCLLIALIVGAAVCAIPRLTSGSYLLLPYAGILTAIIAGACACNLYGSDGTSLWLTVMTPDSSRADVRGRQAAWLIVVAPYTVAVTIAFTALSGEHAAWPWVLAVLPAVLGGAAGLAPFSSLISVQPLDETGGPTPAYSLKVHIALVVVTLTALAPVAVLVAARLWHESWLTWVGRADRRRDRRGAGGLPRRAGGYPAAESAGPHPAGAGRRRPLGRRRRFARQAARWSAAGLQPGFLVATGVGGEVAAAAVADVGAPGSGGIRDRVPLWRHFPVADLIVFRFGRYTTRNTHVNSYIHPACRARRRRGRCADARLPTEGPRYEAGFSTPSGNLARSGPLPAATRVISPSPPSLV